MKLVQILSPIPKFNVLKSVLLESSYRYSPIGILSLVCAKVLAVDDPIEFFSMLAMLIVTLMTALAAHTVALTVIYFLITRKNPLVFFEGIVQALITAFATQSR